MAINANCVKHVLGQLQNMLHDKRKRLQILAIDLESFLLLLLLSLALSEFSQLAMAQNRCASARVMKPANPAGRAGEAVVGLQRWILRSSVSADLAVIEAAFLSCRRPTTLRWLNHRI
jgi:hypothetical protein